MECKVKWIGPDGMGFVAETESSHSFVMDGAPEGGGRNLGPRPMETVLAGTGEDRLHRPRPEVTPSAFGRPVHHEGMAAFGFGDEPHPVRADPLYFALHLAFLSGRAANGP